MKRVKVTLTSSEANSAFFGLKSADGVDYKFECDGTKWSGTAPLSGDYLLTVVRARQALKRINYTLKLIIK